jgi:DNA modification methylase
VCSSDLRQGDLWILGNHRLLNGDSTDPNNIKRLMGDDRIDCIWQDPPYGIAYRSAGGINHTTEVNDLRDHLIANDALKIDALLDLMRRQIQAMRPYLRPGAAVYWCHDIRFNTVIRDLLEQQEIHVADTLIWKKIAASTWLTDYAKFYEPIFYGWVAGAQHEWHGKGMTPNAIQLDQLDALDAGELREIIRSQVSNYQEFSKEPRKIASLHPTVKPAQQIAHHLMELVWKCLRKLPLELGLLQLDYV